MGRPRSVNPSAAALRKRRQMEKSRAEERGLILLLPSKETMDTLAAIVELGGGTVKGEAEAVLRRAAGSALAEIQRVAAKFGPIYLSAQSYVPYARYLETPGSSFRVGTRVLREVDYRPLRTEIGALYEALGRRGWTKTRVTKFLERAAERAAAGAKLADSVTGSRELRG